MNPFPFNAEEWQRVSQISLAVTNATLADDDVLRASQFVELQAVLAELRAVHGEHPVLIETEADFEDDPSRQLELYRAALGLSEEHPLPTLSIRISLAGLLLGDFGDAEAAAQELSACQAELDKHGDDRDRAEWLRLLDCCRSP
jgi:hypothetical protein